MGETFFAELIDKSRFLCVLYDNLQEAIKKDGLYKYTEQYLEEYAHFNNIDAEKAIDIYTGFITIYNRHCKQFIKTGKYPAENGSDTVNLNREEYDIVLLLSVLFTAHRFRIMQLINEANPKGSALFIGLGPGLELALTKDKFTETHTYDLSASEFLFSRFSGIHIHTELYTGQKQDYFDAIYMIELLEHLADPFLLLEICYRSLKKGGRIFLTTATDIPQFDHLYNFPKDHGLFEERIKKMGFSVLKNEMIEHNYLAMEIKPCNHFYILERM